ncbi:MAG: hypothetical protein H7Y61_13680 [Rhizobiales bacterium]|nr:hypothetical protein [Rhizobacter sp.]
MTELGLPRWVAGRRAVASTPWDRDELGTVRQVYCALVIVAAAAQLMFFWSIEDNAASTLLALASSLIGITHALDGRRFRALPVSALILLLYTTTATSGALLVKTLEWSALADRLTVPVTTFAVLLGTQLALIGADLLYQRALPLQNFRGWLTRRALMPLGVMRWPSDAQLWLLGLIGCASVLIGGTDFESATSFGLASAGGKIIKAFGFLKYAPFLIPFRDALGGVPRHPRLPLLALVLYFAALVGISFATNSRSTFADAVPTIGICVLSALALGRIDVKRIPPAQLIVFVLVAVLASIVLSRVALAMVVARDYRYGADAATVVRTTIEALFNSEWLAAAKAKMDTSVAVGNYSEEYVDSRFFARFLLTKFHDNVLYYFSLMGPDQIASYKGFMLDRLAATLPDPALRLLGLSIDKQDLIFSNGDYLVYIVDGWGLGSFKTGSMVAEVFGVFGWAWPLVMITSGIVLFVFYDALAMPTAEGRLAMSPLIILLIWNLCGTTAAFGLGAETVTAIFGGIVRTLPQNVLVYALAVWAVKQAMRLWGRAT